MSGRNRIRVAAALGLLALLAWLAFSHRLVLEKLLTALILPVGLVWIGLATLAWRAWRRGDRTMAAIAVSTWLMHTVSGVDFFANLINHSLEAPYVQTNPLAEHEPLGAVVLLGGGTMVGANGQPQLGISGDRLLLAARFYHAGLTKRIVVTGKGHPALTADPTDSHDQAFELLCGLGIPAAQIDQLGGYTTSEELQLVAQSVPAGQRVGLITSAWHMDRAVRLAQRNGLSAHPLPADYRSPASLRPLATDLVPNAEALMTFSAGVREYLARLVGR